MSVLFWVTGWFLIQFLVWAHCVHFLFTVYWKLPLVSIQSRKKIHISCRNKTLVLLVSLVLPNSDRWWLWWTSGDDDPDLADVFHISCQSVASLDHMSCLHSETPMLWFCNRIFYCPHWTSKMSFKIDCHSLQSVAQHCLKLWGSGSVTSARPWFPWSIWKKMDETETVFQPWAVMTLLSIIPVFLSLLAL